MDDAQIRRVDSQLQHAINTERAKILSAIDADEPLNENQIAGWLAEMNKILATPEDETPERFRLRCEFVGLAGTLSSRISGGD